MAALQRSGTVAALGTAQTLAWAGPHLLLGLPLKWCLPALDKPAAVPAGAGSHHAAGLLALAFAALVGPAQVAGRLLEFGVLRRHHPLLSSRLAVPARFAQVLALWLFGLLLARWGAQAMWFSAGLGLLAFTALMLMHEGRRAATL